MRKIVVIGIGFPDVIRVIEAINKNGKIIDFLGFLDDKEELQGETYFGYRVIGKLDWLKDRKDKCYVVSTIAATTEARKLAHKRIINYGAKYTTLIHPDIDISHSTIGKGVIICEGATIGPNSVIHDHVIVSWNSSIGHDAIIGKFSFIAVGAAILGHVIIGEGVMVGANSACYPKVRVGDWSTIGMCSSVMNNVPDRATFVGNPARIIYRKSETY